jgi:beta-aspartyl-peptidase (threonine type)
MHVIAHGGAGGAPDDPEPRQATLDDAAAAGAAAATPLDAVVETVRRLESDPAFNAGVGGSIQSDGVVRTDAGLMTGDRRVGAASSMPGVEHAVSVARVVLEETPHVLLSGRNAAELGRAFGVETGTPLTTDDTLSRWADEDAPPAAAGQRAHRDWVRDAFGGSDGASHRDHDTVGAVAVADGDIAAATSTGGRWGAIAGRVGDVPQVGSGFHATPAGGVSATGEGEDIARVTLARRATAALEDGLDAQTAADRALAEFDDRTGSLAGLVVADADGNSGAAYNTEEMQTATATR